MDQENRNEKMEEVMLPGFRFHPTDEELVGFYLRRKIQHRPLSIELIKQLDIYKYDPWDLPSKKTNPSFMFILIWCLFFRSYAQQYKKHVLMKKK